MILNIHQNEKSVLVNRLVIERNHFHFFFKDKDSETETEERKEENVR